MDTFFKEGTAASLINLAFVMVLVEDATFDVSLNNPRALLFHSESKVNKFPWVTTISTGGR